MVVKLTMVVPVMVSFGSMSVCSVYDGGDMGFYCSYDVGDSR